MTKWERKASTEEGPRRYNGVIKLTVGEPVRKQCQISVEGTLGTPRGTCTHRHFTFFPLESEGGHVPVGDQGGLMLAQ